MKEAKIIVDGVELTEAQSATVRVALVSFEEQVYNDQAALGPIAQTYRSRCAEVLLLILRASR